MSCARNLRDLIRSGEAGRLRQGAGISQETMAAGLGIARRSLGQIENGRAAPGLALAASYMRVLRGLRNHEAVSRELAQQRMRTG